MAWPAGAAGAWCTSRRRDKQRIDLLNAAFERVAKKAKWGRRGGGEGVADAGLRGPRARARAAAGRVRQGASAWRPNGAQIETRARTV